MIHTIRLDFLAKNQHTSKKHILKFLPMSVHQKFGIILESKGVQKLSLEKNVFTKKLSPELSFLNDFFWKNSVDF